MSDENIDHESIKHENIFKYEQKNSTSIRQRQVASALGYADNQKEIRNRNGCDCLSNGA